MKSGLSLRRSKGALSDKERLAALQGWTEQPALEAATVVSLAPTVAIAEPPAAPKPKPEKRAPTPVQAPADPQTGEVMPWRVASGAGRVTTYRLPERVYLKLKWLGETTYGTSATKILCDILEPELDRMLRERGIEP